MNPNTLAQKELCLTLGHVWVIRKRVAEYADMSPQVVLSFWLDEIGPKGWYAGGDALDSEIREKFQPLWKRAEEGALALWLTCPSETLAYIILLDQLSRNMHRGSPDAFKLDPAALAAAKMAINRDWDLKIDEPARQFFYMPLMHSENQCDQDRAVRLFKTRMPKTGAGQIDHARAHREIIRRFGRFPYRNEVLGRTSNPAEVRFLAESGYGDVLRELQREKAVA